MFQLIYYTGEGSPVEVGNKYHVYNPSLLTDQTIANKCALPDTAADFRDSSKSFPIAQQPYPESESKGSSDNWILMKSARAAVHQDGKAYTDSTGVEHAEQGKNLYLVQKDVTTSRGVIGKNGEPVTLKSVDKNVYSYQFDSSEEASVTIGYNLTDSTDEYMGHHTGYVKYIFRYSSPYSKTTYPKTKILSPDWSEGQKLTALDFTGWEEDSSLTESEVGSNYLKDKVSKYFARATVAETVAAVNSKF